MILEGTLEIVTFDLCGLQVIEETRNVSAGLHQLTSELKRILAEVAEGGEVGVGGMGRRS